ncbi:MAG: PHP domain-containing protein [Candidatus Omnitrophota bacterium]
MIQKFADLHIHSTFSDGTCSPKEVIKQAHEHKLSAIAITDHDSVDAIESALTIAESYDIELIPAVELSAEEDTSEVHILGYFIDWQNPWFLSELEKQRQCRIDRVEKMVKKLNEHNIKIDVESVYKISGCGSVGRLHIAQVMLNRGYIVNIKDAFTKYIGAASPCYVGGFKLSLKDTIAMIHKAGGIAVCAHPGTLSNIHLLYRLIDYGIDGIEVYHPDHVSTDTKRYLKIAAEHKLLVTGGSDWHGHRKEGVTIGVIKVPYELVKQLKDRVDSIKK